MVKCSRKAPKLEIHPPRNIYLVIQMDPIYYFSHRFGLVQNSWLIAPKTPGIPQCREWLKVSCYVNKVSVKHQGWWNWLPGEPTTGFQGLELQSHPSFLGSIVNDQWFNQSSLCNRASINPERMGFAELLGVNVWENGTPLPHTLPLCLSPLRLFLSYTLLQ